MHKFFRCIKLKNFYLKFFNNLYKAIISYSDMTTNVLDFENNIKKYISDENKLFVLQRQNFSCARPISDYVCPISIINNSLFDASGYCFEFLNEKFDNNNVNNIIAVCPNCFCVKKKFSKMLLKQQEINNHMDLCN